MYTNAWIAPIITNVRYPVDIGIFDQKKARCRLRNSGILTSRDHRALRTENWSQYFFGFTYLVFYAIILNDRTRRGGSGALYPQSAIAGLNSCPRINLVGSGFSKRR